MRDVRKLTGNWYLERRWGSYIVMVEVKTSRWDDPTYGTEEEIIHQKSSVMLKLNQKIYLN